MPIPVGGKALDLQREHSGHDAFRALRSWVLHCEAKPKMPLRGGLRGGGRGRVHRGPRGVQEEMADDEPEDLGWEPTGEDGGEDGGRKLLPNVNAFNRILRHTLEHQNLPIARDGCASLA